MTVPQSLEVAMKHHQAGRLEEARILYLQILQSDPNQPDAMNLLGFIERQTGNYAQAIEWTRKAIAIAPNDSRFHFNLGETLRAAGLHEQAIDAYGAALECDPRSGMAHHALGLVLEKLKRDDEALQEFEHAIALNPRLAPAYESLANAYYRRDEHAKAADACRKGLAIDPNRAPLHAQLAAALTELHDCQAAMAEDQQAAALWPQWAMPHVGMATILQSQGKVAEAEQCARRAIALDANFAPAHNALALALDRQGRLGEARQHYERSIALAPDDPRARANLAILLQQQLEHERSLELLQQAVALQPGFAAAHGMLLAAMNYADGVCPERIAAEHRAWAAAHAARFAPECHDARPADPDIDRPLRIGYLSADLIEHPVAHFIEPILVGHNRRDFQPIVFCDASRVDDMTHRLRGFVAPQDWHNIQSLDDCALARCIRENRIDILLDLAGHTCGNRLLVLARKPAPVQVTYLGYPNTTGLPPSIVGWRITDSHCDPPGHADMLHTERLLRMPRTFLCYAPSHDAPRPAPPPFLTKGFITFGSFNNAAKITRKMLGLWKQILDRVPQSRLLLKNKALDDAGIRDCFNRCGIDPGRLVLAPPEMSHLSHLDRYREVDIALDTFPYHGTTTTCEAAWMGVPVITLAGEVHRARVGVSLLNGLGLPQFIAKAPEQYVEFAANLAADVDLLRKLRTELRPRMLSSPLMDGAAFMRDLEGAYRAMWTAACNAT